MDLGRDRYDAVVVGGGLAGVVAARDLTERGNAVLVLEARDRLGGRTWSTNFPGADIEVEMGGQFVLDGERWPELTHELRRYRVGTEEGISPESYPTLMNGVRRPGPMPIPSEQILDLERAAMFCQHAAARIDPAAALDLQDLSDLDIPLSEFLAPLQLPQETYEYVTAVAGLLANRYPEESSALQTLQPLALLGLSVISLWGSVSVRAPMGALVELIGAETTDVRLDSPVVRVDQTGDDVSVTTAAGETMSGSAVIVALPMNIWNDIEFVPPLSETKRSASGERHGTERSGKVWVRVRNAPPRPFVFAAPRSAGGAHAISTVRELDDGDQLMAMFGFASVEGDDYHLDFNDGESVQKALQTLLPGAELVESLYHDYNADPFFKGGWVSFKPGRVTKSLSVLSEVEGRLAFATADVAPKWFMTLEGAVECGHNAAQQTLVNLGQGQ